jgi:hypothetical protein
MCAETEMASMIESVLDKEMLIPALAITLGCGTGMIWIVCATIAGAAKTRHRERTKRELAAYVAEGSLDPDKAIAMLEAGNGSDEDSC